MAAARQPRFERLYQLARKAAVDSLGGDRAFHIVGANIAVMAIKAEVLGVAFRQDDEVVTDGTVREFITYAYIRATDELEALL